MWSQVDFASEKCQAAFKASVDKDPEERKRLSSEEKKEEDKAAEKQTGKTANDNSWK